MKFQNKYRIPSNRLQGYDYGWHGHYFITICTKNKKWYFGSVQTGNCPFHDDPSKRIEAGNCPFHDDPLKRIGTGNCPSLHPTPIGQIAINFWNEIPIHYPFVELDEYVVMPNHIHGILFFNRPDKTEWEPNKFGIQSQNLGAVIRGYKSSVKRYANLHDIEFEWQARYHDHIIRDETALNAIRRYIRRNPAKWLNDSLYLKK